MIKNLSQLLTSSNNDGTRREHFCPASLRDKHFEYCIDSEAVRTDMPKQNFFMRFHSEQYQFRVPFIIYTDCGAILQSLKDETELNLEAPYSREINCDVPSGFCTYATFAYGEVGSIEALSGQGLYGSLLQSHQGGSQETLPYVPSNADGTPNAEIVERVQ